MKSIFSKASFEYIIAVFLLVFITPIAVEAETLSVDESLGNPVFMVSIGPIAYDLEYIGIDANGSLSHSGGTNTVSDALYIGYNAGSEGAYYLYDSYNDDNQATVITDRTVIGSSGNGLFQQFGGINTITNDLSMGINAGSEGKYILYGGTLNVGGNILNGSGTSSLIVHGGVLNVGGGSIEVDYFGLDSMEFSGGPTGFIKFDKDAAFYLGPEALTGIYTLSSGSLTAASEITGVINTGEFNQTGGINTITYDPAILGSGNLYIGYNFGSSGTYNLSGGALIADNEQIGFDGEGTFNQTGGSNTVTNDLHVGLTRTLDKPSFEDLVLSVMPWPFHKDLPLAPTQGGTYNLSGGTLSATNIINDGTFNYTAGELNANVTNNTNFNFSGPGTRTVNGDFTNNSSGIIKATNTDVVFNGLFTNEGAYISDPSSNYFQDLVITDTGYLQGGVGDHFYVSGDFINNSTQASLWNTEDAELSFTGTGSHEFFMADWSIAEDFAWGGIELADGGSLIITGDFTADLYVDQLFLSFGSSLDLNGFNLYCSTFVNLGGTYTGGMLYQTPVPEPATILLIGTGLIGLAGTRLRRKKK